MVKEEGRRGMEGLPDGDVGCRLGLLLSLLYGSGLDGDVYTATCPLITTTRHGTVLGQRKVGQLEKPKTDGVDSGAQLH